MYLTDTQKIHEGEKWKYNKPSTYNTQKVLTDQSTDVFGNIRDHIFLFSFLLQPITLFPAMAKWGWGLFHQVVTPALEFFITLGTWFPLLCLNHMWRTPQGGWGAPPAHCQLCSFSLKPQSCSLLRRGFSFLSPQLVLQS